MDDGTFGNAAYANFDVFEDCAYYSFGNTASVGTAVLDVSDPENPVQTALLTMPACAPWESLRVNLRRGLLASGNDGEPWFDVYDIAEDGTQPELLSSVELTGNGHEGWFSPDCEDCGAPSGVLESGTVLLVTHRLTGPPCGAPEPTCPCRVVPGPDDLLA